MKKINYFLVVLLALIPQIVKAQQADVDALKKYYDAIEKFNGNGPIPVEKAPRHYKGDIPFKDYYKTYRDKKVRTFIDEKFVFLKESRQQLLQLQKKMEEIKNKTSMKWEKLREYNNLAPQIMSILPTDTFGITFNDYNQMCFIDLRTGTVFDAKDLNDDLESIAYLAREQSIPDYIYDPSYSLYELLSDKFYKPDSPEKMCKALEGIEVYRTDIREYDIIKSIKVRREYKGLEYDVEFQKPTQSPLGRLDNIVSYSVKNYLQKVYIVKWLEKLKKCIGMQVIYFENEMGYSRQIYQEDLPKYKIWTLDNIIFSEEDGDQELVAIIKNGEETKRLGMRKCIYLTHDDLKDIFPENYRLYDGRVLPYDYVVKHAKKSNSKKEDPGLNMLVNYAKMPESWVGRDLNSFLSVFPKAKLVRKTISGGKAIRVYHVKGKECIFKDGKCTSVDKI